MTRAYRAIRLAIAFLTILPVPIRDDEPTPTALADARFAYPLVGLLLGLILAGLSALLRSIGANPGPSAVLLLATSAILTGGLHLDGLADTADGLFLRGDPGRRLEVMRDPRVGSFGVVALVILLLGKYAALESLGGMGRTWAILGASIVSRCQILVSAGLSPYARPEGTGRFLVESATWRDALGGSLLALAVGATSVGWRGLVGASIAIGMAIGLGLLARRNLGGVTGDILGASVELGEWAFLLVMAFPVR